MRRVGVGCLVVIGWAATGHAGPTTISIEGGAEADSNVQRVESGPGIEADPIAAPVARLGGKLTHRGRAARGAYALVAGMLSRTVIGNTEASIENVLLVSSDLKWLRPIGKRAVSAGFGLGAVDAIPFEGDGSRTFRTLGGDGILVLRSSDDRSLTLAFGGRRFEYKPEPKNLYDWVGAVASLRLDLTLWQPSGGTRSLELAATFGFEARSYESTALANACAQDEMPSEACFKGTSLTRSDRFQRAGVEVTWTGRVLAALAYQISINDSNSFGQSLIRHRVTVSATTTLPWQLHGTALATLQFDQYLDGLLIQRDVTSQTFTTLDDENRSSLQVRLGRQVSKAWSAELRGALWRNLGGQDTKFRRELVYLGAVYHR